MSAFTEIEDDVLGAIIDDIVQARLRVHWAAPPVCGEDEGEYISRLAAHRRFVESQERARRAAIGAEFKKVMIEIASNTHPVSQ